MTTAHTPTPWKVVFDGEVTEILSANGTTVTSNTMYYPTAPDVEDMEHIVKCVNMHEELVEALLDAKYALYGNGPCNPKIEEALKKAGAL